MTERFRAQISKYQIQQAKIFDDDDELSNSREDIKILKEEN